MNIVDIVIVVFIILSMIGGFRRGVVNSAITLVGTILVFILSFYLKTPVSIFMYEHFPFFSLKGIFENITVINILIYEGLSFLLTASILGILLKVILKVTGLIDAILSKLVLLGLPSKILGIFVGAIQGYLILFVVLFAMSAFSKTNIYLEGSKYSEKIMNNTPVLSGLVKDTLNSVNEVYEICLNNENKETANLESLDVLMKYDILSYKSANKLLESGKLKLNNADSVIEKYRSDN